MKRSDQEDHITMLLSSYWRFPPKDDELNLLWEQTQRWSDLSPMIDAVESASRSFEDRPSVAWILREARRLRKVAEAELPAPRQIDPRPGIEVARGGLASCRAELASRGLRTTYRRPDGDAA